MILPPGEAELTAAKLTAERWSRDDKHQQDWTWHERTAADGGFWSRCTAI
jgi:hypothetical protein